MELARRYANPRAVAQAIDSGDIWEGEGALRVEARDVLSPRDEVRISVSRGTYLPVRVDIKAQFDGDPILIGIDYVPLQNGPAMMTRMTVRLPAEEIAVNVEAFDFERSAAVPIP